MNGAYLKKTAIAAAGVLALMGLTGCATTGTAQADATDAVVFGKLKLIKNGEEAPLGKSFFAGLASLNIEQVGGHEETVAKVGWGGEFDVALAPGEYRITGLQFTNRGERVYTDTDFAFTVSDNSAPVYLGTLTLETSFSSGYYGMSGQIDRFSVSDECARECMDRLGEMGLAANAPTVALIRQEGQLATNRRPGEY
jgi:hypothetical protein